MCVLCVLASAETPNNTLVFPKLENAATHLFRPVLGEKPTVTGGRRKDRAGTVCRSRFQVRSKWFLVLRDYLFFKKRGVFGRGAADLVGDKKRGPPVGDPRKITMKLYLLLVQDKFFNRREPFGFEFNQVHTGYILREIE